MRSAERGLADAIVAALRRYARASIGERVRADACVERALKAVLRTKQRECLATALYGALYRELIGEPAAPPRRGEIAEEERLAERVRALEPPAKHALLLRRLEQLEPAEIGEVMGLSEVEVEHLLHDGLARLRGQTGASILIIEDNFLIANHLSAVMADLGHAVTAIAATAEEAIAAARTRHPDIVLADVELGGTRSGIDAIAAIREREPVAAIYVTGFPERVYATGQHADPTYVVTKPFQDHVLRVAIAEALRPPATRAHR